VKKLGSDGATLVWVYPVCFDDVFAENREVWLVRGEREKDEVGVQPVDDVSAVRLVSLLHALCADEVHDLV
jgi:hypothetical protein